MTFWKTQNYDNSKKISDGQEYAGWWNEGRGIQEFLEQWNYSVWHYNDGHVSLHVYQNPLKVHCAML